MGTAPLPSRRRRYMGKTLGILIIVLCVYAGRGLVLGFIETNTVSPTSRILGQPSRFSPSLWWRYSRIVLDLFVGRHPGVKKLPLALWQTSKTHILSPKASMCATTWQAKNPNWKAFLADDEEMEAFFRAYWPREYVDFVNAMPLPVMRADIWRYAALATFGGVYTDVDSLCTQPIDAWLAAVRPNTPDVLLVGVEDEGGYHFVQWTILATTRHPALQFVMQHLLSNWRRKKDGNVLDGEHFVHELTGPGIWTEAIAHYLGREGKSAGELFAAYSNDPVVRAEMQWKGVYLLPRESFNRDFSRNLYASQWDARDHSFPSWIAQRERFSKERANNATLAAQQKQAQEAAAAAGGGDAPPARAAASRRLRREGGRRSSA